MTAIQVASDLTSAIVLAGVRHEAGARTEVGRNCSKKKRHTDTIRAVWLFALHPFFLEFTCICLRKELYRVKAERC